MFGLLGRKLGHSLSPEIHSFLGDYEYKLYPTEPENLEAFFASDRLKGYNVTIPYKVDAYNHCSVRSETAEKAHSVNTVIRLEDGSLYGDNTDYFGFLYMARKCGCDFKNKKVLILGSGGSSLTVRLVAADEGAREIVVVSRSGENNYENIHLHFDADIIVNTTPVGMYPRNGERLINLADFKKCKKVLDIIYNPARTQLLLDAQELGIDCINGLPMLVAQALKAAEVFTGKEISVSKTDEIHDKIISAQKNIVLIGMPGCGKSTVAALLSELTGRACVDTDSVVEECGETIPEIFEKYGQDEFRKREAEAVALVAKEKGRIIATGGGAILKEENRNALRGNSTVIFLSAPVERLATNGRPLSSGGVSALEKLYTERLPLYKKTADIEIPVDPNPEITVRRVLECISL